MKANKTKNQNSEYPASLEDARGIIISFFTQVKKRTATYDDCLFGKFLLIRYSRLIYSCPKKELIKRINVYSINECDYSFSLELLNEALESLILEGILVYELYQGKKYILNNDIFEQSKVELPILIDEKNKTAEVGIKVEFYPDGTIEYSLENYR